MVFPLNELVKEFSVIVLTLRCKSSMEDESFTSCSCCEVRMLNLHLILEQLMETRLNYKFNSCRMFTFKEFSMSLKWAVNNAEDQIFDF